MAKSFWEIVLISFILIGCNFDRPSANNMDVTIAIPAQGELEPSIGVKKVQAPIDGVVKRIYVKDGDNVKKGDLLILVESITSNTKSEIRSPIDGTVMELLATQGRMVNSNTSNALMQIVPSSNLIAKIYIASKDICFVEKGLPVEIRIDSFPFLEFGGVKGTLEWIGTDVLPPDKMYSFYRFPAKVKLDRQTISIKQKEVHLQSGMSINTNIQLTQRTSYPNCPTIK